MLCKYVKVINELLNFFIAHLISLVAKQLTRLGNRNNLVSSKLHVFTVIEPSLRKIT